MRLGMRLGMRNWECETGNGTENEELGMKDWEDWE